MTSTDQYEETDSETLRLDHELARARSLERMTVHLADDRLLRKPATKQRRRITEQRERLRAEAVRQLAGREPHNGAVSVEIAVLAGEDLQPPQARDVVKAYIDLLIGLAYHDDCQIAHLIVSRSALDHPAMIAGIKRYGRERLSGPRTLRTPRVLIGIEPVEQYTFAYDRARRLAEQERDRRDKVEAEVNALPMLTGLPNADPGTDEDKYNIKAAQAIGALCLDKKFVYDGGPDKMEICDILTRNASLIHVKHRGSSSTLSHLFAQGINSAERLLLDQDFRNQARAVAEREDPSYRDVLPATRPLPTDHEISFVVITRSTRTTPLTLPFFSIVSLRAAASRLQGYGFPVSVAAVQEQ